MTQAPMIIDAATVRARLPFPALISALRAAFVAGATVPLRHRHDFGARDCLLLMPAWREGAALGVKIVTAFPGNNAQGLNAISSTYLLCDPETGRHIAVMDGGEITGRRTAGASALAADYLARRDASRLLVVGAGHIASLLPPAMAAIRPITQVRVWNHRPDRALALITALRVDGFDAELATDLAEASAWADIISCATLSRTALIEGGWLRPGTHIDLVGGYMPTMREVDDIAVRRARVFIDTDAALAEAGDIVQPLASGALTRERIEGDLFLLCREEIAGRQSDEEITLFKSVGSAIEDLAAAGLVYAGTKSSAG